MARSKKQPSVELAVFNDGIQKFTTEEIEEVRPFQNFKAPDTRHKSPQSKVILKDGRCLRTLHTVKTVKELIKDAGGRLRGSNRS